MVAGGAKRLPPTFSMKKPFFARHALLVLVAVFFFVPFAMRGSRYAVQRMKNDVKDWLPSGFDETKDLQWFQERFLGEQFVVISWDGCHGTLGDERFMAFVDNLFPDLPPSAIQDGIQPHRREDYIDRENEVYARSYIPKSAKADESFIGNRLSLRTGPDLFFDWGGKQEKWVRSGRNDWVYITPRGELYQWTGNRSWPAQAWRGVVRAVTGDKTVEGDFVADFDPIDGPWYYEDPSRLNARMFKSISSGPSVLSQLTQSGITAEQAHERLSGVLFGPDGKQTCIVVTLTEAAKNDPRALVGRGMLGKERGVLLDVAEASGVQAPRPPPALPGFLASLVAEDIPPSTDPMLRLGGPPVDNAAIDEEGQITLARLLGLSLAVGLGLSWLCFRSVNITLMVFLVGGISAVTSVGIVYWTGSQLDAVLMSMPSLVYVLGISGAVHVVNYYRESVVETGLRTAPDHSVRLGLWPCTMAAFTTSLGLVSLANSNIVPIRKFGIYAAVGVIATLILLFTFLPAALEMWPPRRYLKRSSSKEGSPASAIERFLDSFWQAVGRFVIDHYRIVGIACAIGLLAGAYGLTKISTDIQLLKLFDAKAKIITDYQWLEDNLGKLVPMEIVVSIDPELFDPSAVGLELEDVMAETNEATPQEELNPIGLDFLERMEIARRVATEIDNVFGDKGKQWLSRPMTAASFAPEQRTKGWLQARTRKPIAKRLEENRSSFEDVDFLRTDQDNGHELWRVSLRLAALDGIDFGEFVQHVQRVVEPIMLAYEYRETIVRRLRRGDDPKNPSQLFFVGFGVVDPNAAEATVNPDDITIDQARIFVVHLMELLQAEGIRINPAKNNITMPEQLDRVDGNDAVIVLNKVDGVSDEDLNARRALRVNALSHEFEPGDSTARKRSQSVAAVYTGLVPIVYKAQRTLLESLFSSTGLAFIMIAGVMILLLRSPRAGLISMFPNVFPVVVIFGYMGWKQIAVDIGSMMTASVAMGVAVDDTIHFLSWFRKGIDEGGDRRTAILKAYKRVATAMTQTTAIGGIGLSIFAFSTFTPTQRFGTLMLALLAAALVGDLLFLPALLASSLGRVFDRKKDADDDESPSADSDDTDASDTDADSADHGPSKSATPHPKGKGKVKGKATGIKGVRRDDAHTDR